MNRLIRIGFVASALLVNSSFADFGANIVYQTNGGTSWIDKLVDVNSNSLLYSVSNNINLVELNSSISNTLMSASNLNEIQLLSEDNDFIVKDYKSSYIYDIFHYNSNGIKIKEFLNIKNPIDTIGFDNSNNLLSYSNYSDWTTKTYEGNITSTTPNGVENFTVELSGAINYWNTKFSSNKSKIFTTTYENNGSLYKYRFYNIDNSNGNILFEHNISSGSISYLYDGNNVYINDYGSSNISSLNIDTGNSNWTTPIAGIGYASNINLMENNQTLMVGSYYNSTNTLTILDTSTGAVNCSIGLGNYYLDLNNLIEDKDNNLIVATLKKYVSPRYNHKLAFINPINCNVVYDETYLGDNYNNDYQYVNENNATNAKNEYNPISYVPILKENNVTNSSEFVRYSANGTVLSTTDLGSDTTCTTIFTRTKENNFYFLTDNKVTAINEVGETIAEISVTDTTNCYFRNIVAKDNKFAIKTGNGSIKAYELDSVVSVPEIPEDNTSTVVLNDYNDITVVDNNTSTTPNSNTNTSTLILDTSSGSSINKNTPINLTLIRYNVADVKLSANDGSVSFNVTSDTITANFSQSGIFNVGVWGTDYDGSYIDSNLTFTVVNRAPISQGDTLSVNSNEILVFNKAQYFHDADGDALLLSVANYPSIGRIVMEGDTIIYKPESSSYSTSFDITATDVDGNSTTATFNVNSIYQSSDVMSVTYGWNLLGNSFIDKTLNSSDIVETNDEAWVYENGTWTSSKYGNIEIKAKQGFWLFANSARDIAINAIDNNVVFTPTTTGWSLMATTVDTKLSQLQFGYEKIYAYENGTWIEGIANPNYELKKFKGYWGRK